MSAKIFMFSKVFNSNSCLWTSLLYGRLSIVDSYLSPKDTNIHKIPSSVTHTPSLFNADTFHIMEV